MLTQKNYKTVEIPTSYVSSNQNNFQDKQKELIKASSGTSHSSHFGQVILFIFLYKYQN